MLHGKKGRFIELFSVFSVTEKMRKKKKKKSTSVNFILASFD